MLLQPYKTAKKSHSIFTIEIIIFCFNIPNFQLLLLCVVISFHDIWIVPRSGCGWMVVLFIDWWSFNFGGQSTPFILVHYVDQYFSGQWSFEGTSCSKKKILSRPLYMYTFHLEISMWLTLVFREKCCLEKSLFYTEQSLMITFIDLILIKIFIPEFIIWCHFSLLCCMPLIFLSVLSFKLIALIVIEKF
jgi:hypothetical protein